MKEEKNSECGGLDFLNRFFYFLQCFETGLNLNKFISLGYFTETHQIHKTFLSLFLKDYEGYTVILSTNGFVYGHFKNTST